jgi:hypothetical protein
MEISGQSILSLCSGITLTILGQGKKRFHDEEIAVCVAWRSTFYVTNFREEMGDAQMREMFGKVC